MHFGKRILLAGFFLLSAIELVGQSTASTTTITTDKNDYYPGEWVKISGTGWQNDDSIQLTISHLDPLPNPLHNHEPWYVKPDANGTIDEKWFVQEREFQTSLKLEALGISTGNDAVTYFTDGSGTGTMTVSPTSVCEASTNNSFAFQFRTSNGASGAYPIGSQATIIIPAGWTAPVIGGNISITIVGSTTASIISVTGTGPWTVTISFNCVQGSGNGFNFTYGLPGNLVTASSAGSYTFTTSTRSGPAGAFVNTSSQPIINATVAASLSLTSAPSSTIQTTCISSPITNITYAIGGGATGAGVTGLPSGVIGSYSASVFTISGIPTTSGTFNYTVTTTGGGCSAATATGTITVYAAVNAGDIEAFRSGGRCGVNIIDISSPSVTCPDGSTPTFAWYRKASPGDPWDLIADSTRKDIFPPPGDENRYRYARKTICGSCQSDYTEVKHPITVYMGVTVSSFSSSCAGSNNGSATATVTGGTLPFVYTWYKDGSLYSTSTITSSTTNTINNLGPGSYYVVIGDQADQQGGPKCHANSTAVVIAQNDIVQGAISADQTICSGSNATPLNGTATGSGTLTYQWQNSVDNGSTWNNISGATNAAYTPTGITVPTQYRRIATSTLNGTPCSNISNAISISVNPLPTATISGTTVVCRNGINPTITFTGSNATPPYTFTYNINGGTNSTITTVSGNSITLNAPTGTAGTFSYNLVSVRESSSTTCLNSVIGTATITVNPLPLATISGTTAVCQNGTAPNVTFTGTNATAPYTFTYNINGGTPLTVTTTSGNSVTVPVPTGTPGTYAYNLLNVSDASSTACSNSASGTATITVNPLPTASISGSTAVCQNSIAPMVTFTGSGGTSPYTFTYDINGGAPSTITTTSGNSVTIAVATGSAGTFAYNLVNVRDGSSTSCLNVASGSATIIVNPLPTATISGTTSVCRNGAEPLVTFIGSGGTAPYTFTYNIDGSAPLTITTTSGNSVTISVPTGTAGIIAYNLTGVQDASSTACSNNATGTATITVNPLPTATISGSTEVCQNSMAPEVTFTASGGTAPYTFTYNINGGTELTVTSISGNSVSVSVPTGVAGTYDYNLVRVQDSGSTACINAASGTATIIINPLPNASIIYHN